MPTIRMSFATPAVVFSACFLLAACDPPPPNAPTPAGGDRITHIVVEAADGSGAERRMYVDPTAADAVFLSAEAADAYYAGSGRVARGWEGLLSPVRTVAAGAGGCNLHCARMGCFCMCYDVLNMLRVGVIVERSTGVDELWWLEPDEVGAILITPGAVGQFTGGSAQARNPGTPDGMLIPEGQPVPALPGDVTFAMP